jgi:hypothetical protein
MASKKAGRLAGLAALAGLAYMANKKGEGKTPDAAKSESKSKSYDRDTDTGVDAMASDAAKKEDAVDTGDFMSRRLNRIDTEDGKAYSTNNLSPMSSPKAARSKPREVTTGDFARSDRKVPASKPYVPPAKAKPYVPFSRSPSIAPSGKNIDRDVASEAEQSKLMRSYVPDTRYKLRDTEEKTTGGKTTSVYTNKFLKGAGFEPRDPGGGMKRGADSNETTGDYKKGGKVKKMASGGMTSSASKRADGIASKGKTRGRMC